MSSMNSTEVTPCVMLVISDFVNGFNDDKGHWKSSSLHIRVCSWKQQYCFTKEAIYMYFNTPWKIWGQQPRGQNSLTSPGIISIFNSTTKMLNIYHSCLPNAKRMPSIHILGWSCCLTAVFMYCWARLEMDTEDPSLHTSRPLYLHI